MACKEGYLIHNAAAVINDVVHLPETLAESIHPLLKNPHLVSLVTGTINYHDLLRGITCPKTFGEYFFKAGRAFLDSRIGREEKDPPFLIIDHRPKDDKVGIVLVDTNEQRVVELRGTPDQFRLLAGFMPKPLARAAYA